MSNSYYNAGSFPATGTPATSASMRAELALIAGGFDRLPTLSGNANKLVLINGAETGMTVLTPPAGDLVGTTATQTLTNKTISGAFTGSLTGAASLNVLKTGDTMSGGLTYSPGAANGVAYLNASKVLTSGSGLTFDGTALTMGANPTLSAGTANGVAYLNASKVLTSGSGLTFDGTTLTLDANQTFNNSRVLQWKNTSGVTRPVLQIFSDNNLYLDSEDGAQVYRTAGTERMRLNAAGLSLASTSDLTLSGGTVNGILYLNGSKVATSGSALTFDGTNFTTTGYAAGNGIRSLSGNPVRFYNSANANWSQIIAPAGTGDMQFDTGAGEQMRLTSTGLGIGTSSPGAKLTVYDTSNAQVLAQGTTSYAQFHANNTSGDFHFGIDNSTGAGFGAGAYGRFLYSTGAYPMAFFTNSVERMRIDSSGNLGLGVTPSATASPYKSIELFGAYWMGGNNTTPASYSYTNAYFDGSDKYKTSGFAASLYRQLNGAHAWFTAPSGTAGNAITFTQAMTLDASGNLGVGTSSPQHRLHTATAGNNYIVSQRTTANTSALLLGAESGNTSIYSWTTVGGSTGVPLNFYTGPSVAMTLDASGNLLVGGTSVYAATMTSYASALRSAGLGLRNSAGTTAGGIFTAAAGSGGGSTDVLVEAAGYLGFSAGGSTERSRITSAGNRIDYQPAESAQNTSVTLTVANLQAQIITSNAAVTLTLPTGTSLEGYTTGMATDTAFEVTFIATTANAITIGANGNTTVGNLTVSGNTSGTFKFRKTATNTFTVYRIS